MVHRLKHESVLELYGFCEDSSYVYLILELCSHGELFSFIENCSEPLQEKQGLSLFILVYKSADFSGIVSI